MAVSPPAPSALPGQSPWRAHVTQANEAQVDLKLISLSQIGLSFQVDLNFSCEQTNFSFRGEIKRNRAKIGAISFRTPQTKCDWHSRQFFGNQNNKDFIQNQPGGSK